MKKVIGILVALVAVAAAVQTSRMGWCLIRQAMHPERIVYSVPYLVGLLIWYLAWCAGLAYWSSRLLRTKNHVSQDFEQEHAPRLGDPPEGGSPSS